MNQNTPDLPSETSADSPAPPAAARPKTSTARTAITWAVFGVLLAVFGTLLWIKQTEGGRKFWLRVTGAEAREREAAKALKDLGALVVAGPDGYASSVNLVGKKIDESVLRHIAALRELDHLDLANCNVADDDLWCVADLTNLASLMLTGTTMTGAGLVHLQRLEGLTGLNLANTPLGDDGLAHLTNLQNLRVLDLSKTRVTDAGMKHVAAMKGIRHLLLSNTAVSDAGLESLAQIEGLKRLTIAKTKVTAAGLKRLQEAIPELSIDSPAAPQGGPKREPG
jgi:hypothetical protein